MKKIRISIYIAVYMFSLIVVKAQPSFNLYQLNSLGETNLLNPAHTPRHGFTLGVPMLYQSALSPNITAYDIFRKDQTADESINTILNNDNINFRGIELNSEITPIFLGLKVKKNYFTMGVYANVDFGMGIPKDLIGLIYAGNASSIYMGKKTDFNNLEINALGYGALHFGYTRQVNEKLSLGVRIKYLRGAFNLTTNKANGYLKIDSGDNNAYRFTAYANYEAQSSGYNTMQELRDAKDVTAQTKILTKSILEKPLGSGWGGDIGANYAMNKHWQFSASLLDIGYIKWKEDTKILSKEGLYVIEKVIKDSSDINPDRSKEDFEEVIDSLGRLFSPNESNTSYTTYLTPKLYLGAQYNFTPGSRVNGTVYLDRYRGKFRGGLSVGYSQRVWRLLDLRVNYNIFNGTYNNLGAGFVMNLGVLQLYTMTDNFMAAVNPATAKYTNVRLGMNIAIGSNWDRDGDGIKDRKDQCKKVYGMPIYKGCPDTDGDSIPDPDDKCPEVKGSKYTFGCPDTDMDTIPDYADSCVNVFGLRTLNGCPDMDGDGIADKDDACPELPGKIENNGCPDDDGDGIINSLDQCPDMAGPAYLFGCPDSDGDSIPDKDDKCPTIKGSILGKGCPDSDGDGIDDINDSCAMVAGLAKFNGCPDSDNDGLPDNKDKCPFVAGPVSNNGCPVIKQSVKKLFEKALTGIQFESGKDIIKKQSFPILNDVVKILKENTDYRLAIAGHTDNTGDPEKNIVLSKDRAAAVKKYLIDNGIDFKRLSSQGYGDTKPVADNSTSAGRAKNRRVEFTVLFEDFVEVIPENIKEEIPVEIPTTPEAPKEPEAPKPE